MSAGATEKARKPRGGAGPYRKGAQAERRAKRAYEAAGHHAIRSPQSGSPVDIVAISSDTGTHPRSWVEWVQVKSKSYLAPAEREAVIALAVRHGGVPVLAWIDKNVLHRRDLTTGGELEALPCPR